MYRLSSAGKSINRDISPATNGPSITVNRPAENTNTVAAPQFLWGCSYQNSFSLLGRYQKVIFEMRLHALSRISRSQLQVYQGLNLPRHFARTRGFHASARSQAIKPFLLADIGEGQFSLCLWDLRRTDHRQVSENVKSYNGLWSPKLALRSGTSYARCKVIKRLWKSLADSQVSLRSCIMKQERWPK